MKPACAKSSRSLFKQQVRPALRAGFTLIELMIVVSIIAILAMVALPSYQKQIAKGRRADAIEALSRIVQAQERWRSNRGAYASELDTELKLSVQSDKKHYDLSLSGVRVPASFSFGYIAKATADPDGLQKGDSECKTMSIRFEGGGMFYEAANSDGGDSATKCWPR